MIEQAGIDSKAPPSDKKQEDSDDQHQNQ